MILVSNNHADIWVLFVPVGISFNWSAHVSKADSSLYSLTVPPPAPLSGSITRSSSHLLSSLCSPTLPPIFIVGSFLVHSELGLLMRISGIVTSEGVWTGSFCIAQHTVHDRLSIFSTFITDLILLSLMLFGVLRWKDAQRRGGIVRLLCKQVGLYLPVAVMFRSHNVTRK